MAKLLQGKVAIVTGGGQGLGFAIARALSIDGASVLIVARSADRVAASAASLSGAGGDVEGHAVDITREGAAAEIVGAAVARFGRLDALVNSAGVFRWRNFLEVTADDWERTVATNLTAPFRLTQEAARVLADQGSGGAILNIASIHGQVPDPNVVPHCASKFGLVGLTRACAEALREFGIRVNAIAPGAIEPGSPERRGGSPREKVTQADIATLAVYLVSDLARSITGAVVEMYGSTRTVIQI